MKGVAQVDSTFCDRCEKRTYADPCLGTCGKEYCGECWQKVGVEYKHAVYFSGSGDGHYCFACEKYLAGKGDPRLSAYRHIQRLRREAELYYEDFYKRYENFHKRTDEAEAWLKRLQGKR